METFISACHFDSNADRSLLSSETAMPFSFYAPLSYSIEE